MPGKATLIFRVHLGQVCSNSWVPLSWLVDLKSLAKEAGVYCTSLSLLNWKECHSRHIIAPSHGFFPSTEQKCALNISALSVVLRLTTYRIHFVPYVFRKFLLVLKKASNVSSYSFLTVSFYPITGICVTCIILDFLLFFFFLFLKLFALWIVCSIFFAPCKTFWLTEDRRQKLFWALQCPGRVTVQSLHCMANVGSEGRCSGSLERAGKLGKGKVPNWGWNPFSAEKASAKQICFTSPNLDASLLIKDILRRGYKPPAVNTEQCGKCSHIISHDGNCKYALFPPWKVVAMSCHLLLCVC